MSRTMCCDAKVACPVCEGGEVGGELYATITRLELELAEARKDSEVRHQLSISLNLALKEKYAAEAALKAANEKLLDKKCYHLHDNGADPDAPCSDAEEAEALRVTDIIEKSNLKDPDQGTQDEAHMIVLARALRSKSARLAAVKKIVQSWTPAHSVDAMKERVLDALSEYRKLAGEGAP